MSGKGGWDELYARMDFTWEKLLEWMMLIGVEISWDKSSMF